MQKGSLQLGNPLDAFIILLLAIRRRALRKSSLQLHFFIHLGTEMMKSLSRLVEIVTLISFPVDYFRHGRRRCEYFLWWVELLFIFPAVRIYLLIEIAELSLFVQRPHSVQHVPSLMLVIRLLIHQVEPAVLVFAIYD